MTAIRRATSADAAACVDILRDWINGTGWMPMLHTRASMVGFWEARLIDTKARVLDDGAGVAGFGVFDDGMVTALYLAPSARRLGLGSALLRDLTEGEGDVSLWVFEANTAARAFYIAQGFQDVRRTNGENEEGLPDILMTRAAGYSAAI